MIRVSQVLAVLLLLTTAACHREGSSSEVVSAVAAPKGVVVVPAAPPSPRAAVAPADAGPDEAESVRAAVRSWSDALDRHDADTLLCMYTDVAEVKLYGHNASGYDAVDYWHDKFCKNGDFHHRIVGPIAVAPGLDGRILTARFLERWGVAGAMTETRAKLVFLREPGGSLGIVEEADAASEANLKSDVSYECAETVEKVVFSMPAVAALKRDLLRAIAETDGGARYGGIGPLPDTGDVRSICMGIHTDERFENVFCYDVDPAGHLTVAVHGESLTVPPEGLATVEHACKRAISKATGDAGGGA